MGHRVIGEYLNFEFELFYSTKTTMIKPITNIHDAIEIYIDSGCARLRFKEVVSLESLLDEKPEKQQIPRTHRSHKSK